MPLTLTTLPWYGQVGTLFAVAVAGVGVFHRFCVVPFEEELRTRQAQLDSMRADINEGLMTAQELPEIQKEVRTLELRLESLRAVLPEQKDVGDRLNRIQVLATQSNLTITGFTPKATLAKQLYSEQPIALRLDGTYHSLGSFFDKVSKVPRIINISDIIVKAKGQPDEGSSIIAECTATTFVLLEAAPPAVAQQPTYAPALVEVVPPGEAYTYDSDGRRDPFVSMLNRGAAPQDLTRRPDGLAGLTVGEATLKGIVRSGGSYVAILQAPDNKTYIVRPNDRLYDGSVKSIMPDAVLFLQEVNDPLSLEVEREIRKPLRPAQEGS
jgi:type IV pilus assembly protein PilO